MCTVPLIDLRAAPAANAGAVDAALCEVGFFVIAGHGVPAALTRRVAAACHAFFERPVAQKEALRSSARGSARGYVSFGVSALARTLGAAAPGDYKESFGMGPPRFDPSVRPDARFHAANLWPEFDGELRAALEAWYAAMEGVGRQLQHLFALALGLPADWFDAAFVGHNSTLRALYYPHQLTQPQPGQVRAGEHTDYGAWTILRGEDVPGGLQVRSRAGTWLDIHAPADCFVINVGDLMMRWTNDRWLSNLHRVANPPDGEAGCARLALAYFANPREDALIAALPTCTGPERPVRHAPILAGEHRLGKIRAAEARGAAPAPAEAAASAAAAGAADAVTQVAGGARVG